MIKDPGIFTFFIIVDFPEPLGPQRTNGHGPVDAKRCRLYGPTIEQKNIETRAIFAKNMFLTFFISFEQLGTVFYQQGEVLFM